MRPNLATVTEFEEQVGAFFRRASTKSEAEAALLQHSGSLLEQIKELLPILKESPAYAGMAFYGRLQAVNLKLIKKLAADGVGGAEAIEAVRAAKALRVGAAAKPAWDLLITKDPNSLWMAILLNLIRQPGADQTAVAGPSRHDEDEEGEEHEDEPENEEDDDDKR